jgi:hypothetical protein
MHNREHNMSCTRIVGRQRDSNEIDDRCFETLMVKSVPVARTDMIRKNSRHFLQNQCVLSVLFRVRSVEKLNTFLGDGRCQRI